MSRIPEFFAELSRRRVVRVGVVYLAAGWAVIEVADTVLPNLSLPGWSVTLVIVLVSLGLPVALALAWAFDITPRGVVKAADSDLAEIAAASEVPPASIAVLPFRNLSADPENEYFSDGITEELIGALTRVGGLQVAARTSVFAFKDRSEDVRAIGRQLSVGAILEGSVRKHGDRVRIGVQLVGVSDGYQLWSSTYDREIEDIFGIQEEISLGIVENLRIRLLPEGEQALSSYGTESVGAYNIYLKGRYYLRKRTWQAFERAVECFHAAIEADPRYALAHAGLADVYLLLERYGVMRPREAIREARSAALTALEIEPQLAEVHVALAYLRMIGDWDGPEAGREFRRAIELNPEYPPAHHLYGWFLASQGRLREALEALDRAIVAEPFRLISLANRGTLLYFDRRFPEAAEQLRGTLDLDDSFAVAHQWLGRTLEAMGDHSRAIAAHRRALALLGDDPESIAGLAHALAAAGEREEALGTAQRLEALARSRYVSPYWTALVRLGLGETDRAVAGLEDALEDRCDWVLFLHQDPLFDELRDHDRFERLVARVRRAYLGGS